VAQLRPCAHKTWLSSGNMFFPCHSRRPGAWGLRFCDRGGRKRPTTISSAACCNVLSRRPASSFRGDSRSLAGVHAPLVSPAGAGPRGRESAQVAWRRMETVTARERRSAIRPAPLVQGGGAVSTEGAGAELPGEDGVSVERRGEYCTKAVTCTPSWPTVKSIRSHAVELRGTVKLGTVPVTG
jgi:hypothetical protein